MRNATDQDKTPLAITTSVFYLKANGWCYSTNRPLPDSRENAAKEAAADYIAEKQKRFNLHDYVISEDKALLEAHLQKCARTEANVESVLRFKLPDGGAKRVQIISVPGCRCFGPDGCLTIIQDIHNYLGLKDVFNRLDELNLVGKIAGSVAHEVRNPLTVVRGQLQLLGWNTLLKKYNEQLETMISEIDRAVEMLTELLYMSRPSQTRMERQNINEILNHLYQLLNAEALVNLQEVVYQLGEVPDVMLDKKRFRQVVLNLVNNGLQAMDEHKQVIVKTYASDGKVYFIVKDHGKGIPPEVLKKLGTPFVSTKASGTGLGLAACYNIIAEHQAKIEVETGPQGTTFTIIFDAAK
jgi:nitrogen-specific signal transduction histidine kinase